MRYCEVLTSDAQARSRKVRPCALARADLEVEGRNEGDKRCRHMIGSMSTICSKPCPLNEAHRVKKKD